MVPEKAQFRFLDKPTIPIDDRLKQLGDSLVSFVEEVENLPTEDLENVVFVGRMERTDSMIPDEKFLHFTWGYSTGLENSVSLDSLQRMNFENNLDSLIDYEEGFSSPIYFIFPLIECIRRNYNSDKVYLVGDDNQCKFFIKK